MSNFASAPGYPPPYSAGPAATTEAYQAYPPVYTQPPYNPAFVSYQDGSYPPAGYPPTGPTMGYPPPAQGGYPPPAQGGYPPGGYPPTGYPPPPPSGYPPAAGGYQPPPSGYPPPGGYIAVQPAPGAQPGPPPGAMEGWMSVPQGRPVDCPPGLEYLTTLDQLLVHQKVEILEAILGFESKNKFSIKNSLGQKIYQANEKSNICIRCCCGPSRPFEMKILDNFQNEVIHLSRPLACASCWFPCCLQRMEVFSPPGVLAGSVDQNWSILSPSFDIKNAAGDTVLKIEGPICTWSMCGDVEFKVLALDGKTVVGFIRKQWSGLVREAFTDADHFGITFPVDLDVRMKAVMLGACFLIDMMFFEKVNNKEQDTPGMF